MNRISFKDDAVEFIAVESISDLNSINVPHRPQPKRWMQIKIGRETYEGEIAKQVLNSDGTMDFEIRNPALVKKKRGLK